MNILSIFKSCDLELAQAWDVQRSDLREQYKLADSDSAKAAIAKASLEACPTASDLFGKAFYLDYCQLLTDAWDGFDVDFIAVEGLTPATEKSALSADFKWNEGEAKEVKNVLADIRAQMLTPEGQKRVKGRFTRLLQSGAVEVTGNRVKVSSKGVSGSCSWRAKQQDRAALAEQGRATMAALFGAAT